MDESSMIITNFDNFFLIDTFDGASKLRKGAAGRDRIFKCCFVRK